MICTGRRTHSRRHVAMYNERVGASVLRQSARGQVHSMPITSLGLLSEFYARLYDLCHPLCDHRLVNRFSKDLDIIDTLLPFYVFEFFSDAGAAHDILYCVILCCIVLYCIVL